MNNRPPLPPAILPLLIFAGSTAYLVSMPRSLGWSDEAYFLYEAKRIAEGEVMYRDIFQFVTPGASYIMALLYLAFGTTMTTAHVTKAVVHGLIAALVSASCQRQAVRPSLAALAALAYLALSETAWPHASWHWFSTAALVLQCWTLLAAPWPQRPRWALLPGIVSGIAVGVQQQRGLPLAAGVAALFVLDSVLAYRSATEETWHTLLRRLAGYVAGMLLVLVPLLGPSVWLAGVDALIDAWVRFPLENYRATYGSRWGAVGPLSTAAAAQTFPVVLQGLPIIGLALATVGLIVAIGERRGRSMSWRFSVLLMLSGSAVLSVWYNPDFIHLAFVAPIFLISVAPGVEWAWRTIESRRGMISRHLTTATMIATAALAVYLYRNLSTSWERYAYVHETAFGRIHSATTWEGPFIDAIRKQLDASGSLEMFCYPHISGPYLTTGGRNPTPFQYADSHVLPRRYTEEIVRILWQRRVPTLVVLYGFLRRDDPVRQLLRKQYRAVPIPELRDMTSLPPVFLYHHRPEVMLPEPPEFPVEIF